MNNWLIRVSRVWDDRSGSDLDGTIKNPDPTAPLPRAGKWYKLVPIADEEADHLLAPEGWPEVWSQSD